MNSLKFVANTVIENLLKAARVNIITGEYHFIKEFEGEREGGCMDLKSMDDYPQQIVNNGWIHPDDELDYLSHMRLKYLRKKLEENGGRVVHSFRRKMGDIFSWITVEIIAPPAYSDKNPWVLYDWREADNDSRAMEDALCMLSVIFHKILKVNLTLDTHEAVKVYNEELTEEQGYSASISQWLIRFGETGNVHGEDLQGYLEFVNTRRLKGHFKKNKEKIRYRYRRRIGSTFRWVEMVLLPSVEYSDDNQVIMLYIRDIHDTYTEELKYHRELEYYCNYDALTRLRNRYAYNQYCEQCRKGKKSNPMTALFADINGLKYINDHLGHMAGDDYICRFGGMLRESFGEHVICRISGDEFVVFIEEISEEEIREQFDRFHRFLEREKPPVAAVGYAWSDGGTDVEELVSAAEKAMYEDKRRCHEQFPKYCERSRLLGEPLDETS